MNGTTRIRAVAGGLAIVDVAFAALIVRRSKVTTPLFGPPGELYAAWGVGALLAWAGVQAKVALDPTPQGARVVSLLRGLLVPADLSAAVLASGRYRPLYALAGLGNAALCVAAGGIGTSRSQGATWAAGAAMTDAAATLARA